MDSQAAQAERRKLAAFTLPLAVFLLLLALAGFLQKSGGAFWLASARYWVYPAQTFICGALLIWFWRDYDLGAPRRIGLAVALGVLVFALWVAPQAVFGFAPRFDGFNPETFADQPAAYWATVLLRFLRLVVVVPLLEEIFWRGFLLRFLINEKFDTVPMGTFSWFSFAIVTVGFGFSHSPSDYVAAFVTGALYNCVASWTKSLSSCVVAHAVSNLLLGLWIMRTGQWGFW
jgi:CAAX prenyl protease-like protein